MEEYCWTYWIRSFEPRNAANVPTVRDRGLYRINYRKRIKTEEKAKVVAVVLENVLECRPNHLTARKI